MGQTQGRGKLDTHHEYAKPLKNIVVKPLWGDWQTIFNPGIPLHDSLERLLGMCGLDVMLIVSICSSLMRVPVLYCLVLSWEVTCRPVRVEVVAM